MKTRTLLFLAFACGLAILVAGGVQLLRLAGDDDPPPPLAVGETARVGDMRVTVNSAREDSGRMRVEVVLVGVDDADGGTGFRLVVPGDSVPPLDGPSGGVAPRCGATSETTPTTCTVEFDTSTADGSARVLLYRRAGESQRWDLQSPA